MQKLAKVWTGPCSVKEMADKLRTSNKFSKIIEGTEHVLIWSEITDRIIISNRIRSVLPWVESVIFP